MMRLARLLIVALLPLALAGCLNSSKKLNAVSVGMTKAEVIQALGQPDSVSATGGTEYMVYRLGQGVEVQYDRFVPTRGNYYVRLLNGRVDSYGQVGDFDSTKIPESKQTID